MAEWILPPYTVESVALADGGQQIDWGLTLLGIPALWAKTRGKGVRVAILDTGIATQHQDLKDAILDAQDFTGSRNGVADVAGHGSHVAGTIGARDNPGGVVGVAPDCGLLVGKVLGDNGSGSNTQVANGIRWAISTRADIISMSLGSPMPDATIQQAINDALAAGIIVVCAAGNDGPVLDTIGYPAKWPGVISVGSIDRQKQISKFSSRGDRVDIVAPGDRILSDWPPNSLAMLSGTSMATPLVSGVVALMIAAARLDGTASTLTPSRVIELLRSTATDAGPPGKDSAYGYGIIDPNKLLTPVVPIPVPPVIPVPPPTGATISFSSPIAAGTYVLTQVAGS